MGNCLFLGIVDEDKATQVAERLISPEMFSGWGMRTLARNMGAYNPASYHSGSVWPHDNAIIAAGLLRYGLVVEAQRIAAALLEAAKLLRRQTTGAILRLQQRASHRACPLSNGLLNPSLGGNYTDPASDQPDAVRRTLSRGGLGWISCSRKSFGDLHITNAPLAGGRITIHITNSVPTGHGLPEGIVFHHGHRPWMTELVEQADRRKSD